MARPLGVIEDRPASGRRGSRAGLLALAGVLALLAAPAAAQGRLEQGIAALNRGEYDLAIVYLDDAISMNPDDGWAYYNRAQAYVAKGEYEMAILDYSEAIRVDPTDGLAFNNRGAAYSRKADYDRAISDHSAAIRLNPEHARAYFNRGVAYAEQRQYERAIADYTEAVRLEPGDPRPFNNLAWIWATSPRAELRDGGKAIEHATRACELTMWSNWITLGTLAAAYAEAGRFEEAIKWQTAVLELTGLSDSERRRSLSRLALFEQGKPFREGN
jgi:tetratricopeptide (TPR) repeat protein